jgi:uncharacterized protein YoaH (UPF0181 family)
VLGDLETKKLYVLSGCALEKYEAVMASGASSGQMLECAGEWIRRCSIIPGENAGTAALEYRLPLGSMDAALDDDGGKSPDRRVHV